MKQKLIGFLFIVLFFSGCGTTTSQRMYMGYKVYDMSYPVANGETLTFQVTDAGPIPVENDLYKIEVVGLNVFPSSNEVAKAVFTRSFVFTVKKPHEIESVLVEEISPSFIPKMVVLDEKPVIQHKQWTGATSPVEITPQLTPWFYDDKSMIYVYRFTIKPVNEAPIVMNQLVWYAKATKKTFQATIEKINNQQK